MKKTIKCCPIFGSKEGPSDKTRELILIQAKKFFADHGYEGASLREICNAAKANVSAVKYHFGDKEGLYRTCLREYSEGRLAVITRLLTSVNTEEELRIKFKLFAEDFLNESFNDFNMSRILFREIENMHPIMEGIFEETILKIYRQLVVVLDDAKKKNIISEKINSEIATGMFLHFLSQSVRTNHIAEKFFNRNIKKPEIQNEILDDFLNILFYGIKA
jgi:AcrR family transcriptional regulator